MQEENRPLQGQAAMVLQGPDVRPQTISIQNASDVNVDKLSDRYAAGQSLGLGSVQIVCGVVSIIMTIVGMAVDDGHDNIGIGYGIWCGVFFIASGCLGIAAANTPRMALVVGHMVMSVISACMCAVLLAFSVIGVDDNRQCSYFIHSKMRCEALYGLNGVLLAIAVVEAIVAIWAAVLCCSGLCRCCFASSAPEIKILAENEPLHGQTEMVSQGPGTQPASAPINDAECNKGDKLRARYAVKQSLNLGAVQIVCGIVSVTVNIVGIVLDYDYDVVGTGYGIWCGVPFIISGSLGIAAAKKTKLGLVVGHMVMSVISACMCVVLLAFSVIGVDDNRRCSFFVRSRNRCEALHGLNGVLVAVSVVEVVCATWAAVLCCSGLCRCCYSSSTHGTVLHPVRKSQMKTATGTYPQQPVGLYPQQPVGLYPQQPVGLYPQQPVGLYPQQPVGTYPQQPIGFYPQQPVGTYPQQPVVTYPQQPVVTYPQQPVVTDRQQPVVTDPQQPVVADSQQEEGLCSQVPAETTFSQQPTGDVCTASASSSVNEPMT